MHHRITVALLATLLAACGGGGAEGGGPAKLRLSTSSVVAAASTTDVAPIGIVNFSVSPMPSREIHASASPTTDGIARVETATDASRGRLRIFFKDPDRLGPGTYSDQVTLNVCYDPACADPLPGSPRVVEVRYTVTGPAAPEPEPALPVSAAPADGGPLTATTLAMGDHDVIDAAYSEALESIVMISTAPTNALYVFDTAANTETKLELAQAPAAMALGSDGRTVAILLAATESTGAKLVHAALPDFGAPDKVIEASSTVLASSDLLLGSNRVAHLLPGPIAELPYGFVISIHLDKKTVGTSGFDAPLRLTGTLHPAGQAIYAVPPLGAAGTGDIVKFAVGAENTRLLYESDDDGAHPACGRLWVSATGNRLYTACGAAFRASEFRRNDLTHMGNIALFGAPSYIESLSDSVPAGEVAIAQTNAGSCYRSPVADCSSRLGFYDRETMAAAESYAMPEGDSVGFVFHGGSGDKVYVIVRRYNDPLAPDTGPDNLLLEFSRE